MAMNEAEQLSPGAQFFTKVDDAYFVVEKFLNLIAAITILLLMFVGTYQVFGRKLLNVPVPGYVDLVEVSMTTFAFLGLAY